MTVNLKRTGWAIFMNSEKSFAVRQSSRSRRASRRGWRLCALLTVAPLLLASTVWASNARQQQGRPNIANEVEGAEKPKNGGATTNKPAPETRKPTPAETREGRKPRTTPTRTPAPRQSAAYAVTFITGVPDSDIFAQRGDARMQRLGRTGADGRLVARLSAGVHNITASRTGFRTERRLIEVRPGNTTIFNFNLTKGTTPNATGVAVNAPPPPPPSEVIRRFLDPKLTDSVTPADWQAAQTQAAALYALNSLEPQLEVQALFTDGQLAFLRRDYKSAIASFNNAALVMPSSALSYYGLGNAYLASAQLSEAYRAYQRAIELNPQLSLAHKGMGDVLSRQGKNKEAYGYYERARVLGYASPETNLSAARTLLKQRRWSQALREFLVISRTHPTAEVYIGIGDCYLGLKQQFSAAPAYQKAVELDPKSALAHYKYGALVYEGREYASAAAALERALELDPAGAVIDRDRAREMAAKAAQKMRAMK